MDDDVIVIYDEIDEEPEQFTAPNYEYMLAQTLLTKEAIQEKLEDPNETSNFHFVGSASHNNSIWNNFLAVTYGGVEQNFFKCRDCNAIFDKDPQKSLEVLRKHNCKDTSDSEKSIDVKTIRLNKSKRGTYKKKEKIKILTREQLDLLYRNPSERKFFIYKRKSNFKCFAWQFLDAVFYKGQKQPFARCRYCGALVSYSNKNGTSSIRKHALRCPKVLQATRKCKFTEQQPRSAVAHTQPNDTISDEVTETASNLIPEIEIYSDKEPGDEKHKKKNVLSFKQLQALYDTKKELNHFLFRKTSKPSLNWLEAVYYKGTKQMCFKCTECDTLINNDDEYKLTTHMRRYHSNNENIKKKQYPKPEQTPEVPAVNKLRKTFSISNSTETNESNNLSENSNLINESNCVSNKLVDFVVASTGQILSYIEDPSFRAFVQSLIDLGANHGSRNAMDILPNVNSILKQSIPIRVRLLKSDITQIITSEPHLNLSVDLMKDVSFPSNSIHYLTIKFHLITPDFSYRTFVLGTREIRDIISHEELQRAFSNVMKEYIGIEELHTRSIIVLNDRNELLMKAFDNYTRLPSITHSLEFVINEVLQVVDPELNISNIVVKIQQLFNHLTMKHKYYLSQGECLLDILEEFYEMNKPIEKLLKETKSCQKDHTELFDIPKNTVKTILNSFQVIKLCIDTIRQNPISINGILLWKKKLVEHYSPVLYEHRQNARLKYHTLSIIETKFIIDHPIYKIALFLNPNFKNLKSFSEADRIEVFNYIKELFRKLSHGYSEEEHENRLQLIDKEINKYFVTKNLDYANEDLLEFWKKNTVFPNLKIVARCILSVPCTSDGISEDIFQKASRSITNGIGTNADFDSVIFLYSNTQEPQ